MFFDDVDTNEEVTTDGGAAQTDEDNGEETEDVAV